MDKKLQGDVAATPGDDVPLRDGSSVPRIRPATPLPWEADKWTSHAPRTVLIVDATCITGKRVVAECEESTDAAYIVAACNAYPRLVDEIQRLQGVVGEEDFAIIETLLRELGEL